MAKRQTETTIEKFKDWTTPKTKNENWSSATYVCLRYNGLLWIRLTNTMKPEVSDNKIPLVINVF